MTQLARRVVKLGGSLLDCGDLVERWQTWLAAQPPAETLLVVGGGALVDAIRELDRLHALDDAAAHWCAIRAMAVQAEAVASLLPGMRPLGSVRSLLTTPGRSPIPLPAGEGGRRPGEGAVRAGSLGPGDPLEAESSRSLIRPPAAATFSRREKGSEKADACGDVLLVDPWRFMRYEEPELPGAPLPASWDVTSDSIAARVAEVTGAAELVLLKSTLPPPGALWTEAAAAGVVDAWFPRAAAPLPSVRLVNLRDGWSASQATRLKGLSLLP